MSKKIISDLNDKLGTILVIDSVSVIPWSWCSLSCRLDDDENQLEFGFAAKLRRPSTSQKLGKIFQISICI